MAYNNVVMDIVYGHYAELEQEKERHKADVQDLREQLNQEKERHQADVHDLREQLKQEKERHKADVRGLREQLEDLQYHHEDHDDLFADVCRRVKTLEHFVKDIQIQQSSHARILDDIREDMPKKTKGRRNNTNVQECKAT